MVKFCAIVESVCSNVRHHQNKIVRRWEHTVVAQKRARKIKRENDSAESLKNSQSDEKSLPIAVIQDGGVGPYKLLVVPMELFSYEMDVIKSACFTCVNESQKKFSQFMTTINTSGNCKLIHISKVVEPKESSKHYLQDKPHLLIKDPSNYQLQLVKSLYMQDKSPIKQLFPAPLAASQESSHHKTSNVIKEKEDKKEQVNESWRKKYDLNMEDTITITDSFVKDTWDTSGMKNSSISGLSSIEKSFTSGVLKNRYNQGMNKNESRDYSLFLRDQNQDKNFIDSISSLRHYSDNSKGKNKCAQSPECRQKENEPCDVTKMNLHTPEEFKHAFVKSLSERENEAHCSNENDSQNAATEPEDLGFAKVVINLSKVPDTLKSPSQIKELNHALSEIICKPIVMETLAKLGFIVDVITVQSHERSIKKMKDDKVLEIRKDVESTVVPNKDMASGFGTNKKNEFQMTLSQKDYKQTYKILNESNDFSDASSGKTKEDGISKSISDAKSKSSKSLDKGLYGPELLLEAPTQHIWSAMGKVLYETETFDESQCLLNMFSHLDTNIKHSFLEPGIAEKSATQNSSEPGDLLTKNLDTKSLDYSKTHLEKFFEKMMEQNEIESQADIEEYVKENLHVMGKSKEKAEEASASCESEKNQNENTDEVSDAHQEFSIQFSPCKVLDLPHGKTENIFDVLESYEADFEEELDEDFIYQPFKKVFNAQSFSQAKKSDTSNRDLPEFCESLDFASCNDGSGFDGSNERLKFNIVSAFSTRKKDYLEGRFPVRESCVSDNVYGSLMDQHRLYSEKFTEDSESKNTSESKEKKFTTSSEEIDSSDSTFLSPDIKHSKETESSSKITSTSESEDSSATDLISESWNTSEIKSEAETKVDSKMKKEAEIKAEAEEQSETETSSESELKPDFKTNVSGTKSESKANVLSEAAKEIKASAERLPKKIEKPERKTFIGHTFDTVHKVPSNVTNEDYEASLKAKETTVIEVTKKKGGAQSPIDEEAKMKSPLKPSERSKIQEEATDDSKAISDAIQQAKEKKQIGAAFDTFLGSEVKKMPKLKSDASNEDEDSNRFKSELSENSPNNEISDDDSNHFSSLLFATHSVGTEIPKNNSEPTQGIIYGEESDFTMADDLNNLNLKSQEASEEYLKKLKAEKEMLEAHERQKMKISSFTISAKRESEDRFIENLVAEANVDFGEYKASVEHFIRSNIKHFKSTESADQETTKSNDQTPKAEASSEEPSSKQDLNPQMCLNVQNFPTFQEFQARKLQEQSHQEQTHQETGRVSTNIMTLNTSPVEQNSIQNLKQKSDVLESIYASFIPALEELDAYKEYLTEYENVARKQLQKKEKEKRAKEIMEKVADYNAALFGAMIEDPYFGQMEPITGLEEEAAPTANLNTETDSFPISRNDAPAPVFRKVSERKGPDHFSSEGKSTFNMKDIEDFNKLMTPQATAKPDQAEEDIKDEESIQDLGSVTVPDSNQSENISENKLDPIKELEQLRDLIDKVKQILRDSQSPKDSMYDVKVEQLDLVLSQEDLNRILHQLEDDQATSFKKALAKDDLTKALVALVVGDSKDPTVLTQKLSKHLETLSDESPFVRKVSIVRIPKKDLKEFTEKLKEEVVKNMLHSESDTDSQDELKSQLSNDQAALTMESSNDLQKNLKDDTDSTEVEEETSSVSSEPSKIPTETSQQAVKQYFEHFAIGLMKNLLKAQLYALDGISSLPLTRKVKLVNCASSEEIQEDARKIRELLLKDTKFTQQKGRHTFMVRKESKESKESEENLLRKGIRAAAIGQKPPIAKPMDSAKKTAEKEPNNPKQHDFVSESETEGQ